MKLRMTRTFANVGQGLFAIEKFYDGEKVIFCAVYDCGSGTGRQITARHKHIINESLKDEKLKINILFVSHFDNDHINGIPYLLENYNVEEVYIPLIRDEVKVLILSDLVSSARSKNNVAFELLTRPKEYIEGLSSETKILFVSDKGNHEKGNDGIIKTGTSIRISRDGALNNAPYASSGRYFWEYMLHNIYITEYESSLKKLSNNKLCNTFLDKIIKCFESKNKKKMLDKNSKKEFKDFICRLFVRPKELNEIIKKETEAVRWLKLFYEMFFYYCKHKEKIDPGDDINLLNVNSLVVYSGPLETKDIIKNNCLIGVNSFCYEFCDEWKHWRGGYYCHDKYYYKLMKTAGCLFCGDVDGKDKEFIKILGNHEKNLMCMQVPHHGSKNNNDNKTLKNNIFYIICAKKGDKKHPAQEVLMMLISNGKMFRVVDERKESRVMLSYTIK